jgi:uncharacterized membrane protein YbhN (UPF0104 family)
MSVKPSGAGTGQQRAVPGAVSRSKRWYIQLLVSCLLLAFLVHVVGWRALLDSLANADPPWLFLTWCFAVATFAVMAANLFLLLVKIGQQISYIRVLLASALANFYSLIVPGDLMAGLAKWAALSVATGNTAASLSVIVVNKLVLAIPVVIFGFIALAVQNPFPDLPVAELAAGSVLLIVLGLMFGLWRATGALIDRFLLAIAPHLPDRLGRGLGALVDSLRMFRRFRTGDHLLVLLVAFVAYAGGLAAFYCATRTLGIEVPLPTLVWISLALFVSRLLPLTFNNLGIREGLLVLALASHEIAAAKAIGVGLVMFSSAILIALLGGVCQVALALGWTPPAEPRSLR